MDVTPFSESVETRPFSTACAQKISTFSPGVGWGVGRRGLERSRKMILLWTTPAAGETDMSYRDVRLPTRVTPSTAAMFAPNRPPAEACTPSRRLPGTQPGPVADRRKARGSDGAAV